MRRRHDDWINATHILKAAGFDKPARTRILEREVQKDTHEKIQGGYGKYQGAHLSLSSSFCFFTMLTPTPIFQAHGFLSNTARRWPSATASTNGYGPSSSSSQALRPLRLHRDIPASPRPQRPSLLFLHGAVSQTRTTMRPKLPASHKVVKVLLRLPLLLLFTRNTIPRTHTCWRMTPQTT